ncbi:hypothetical protein JTB14_005300 [Gonioctena quinquepunctata]|nr:hypothetical protein JTB14_005300 [Gonioctena quinquepunctata]
MTELNERLEENTVKKLFHREGRISPPLSPYYSGDGQDPHINTHDEISAEITGTQGIENIQSKPEDLLAINTQENTSEVSQVEKYGKVPRTISVPHTSEKNSNPPPEDLVEKEEEKIDSLQEHSRSLTEAISKPKPKSQHPPETRKKGSKPPQIVVQGETITQTSINLLSKGSNGNIHRRTQTKFYVNLCSKHGTLLNVKGSSI